MVEEAAPDPSRPHQPASVLADGRRSPGVRMPQVEAQRAYRARLASSGEEKVVRVMKSMPSRSVVASGSLGWPAPDPLQLQRPHQPVLYAARHGVPSASACPSSSNRDIGTRQPAAVSTDEAEMRMSPTIRVRGSPWRWGQTEPSAIHVTAPAEEAGGETDADWRRCCAVGPVVLTCAAPVPCAPYPDAAGVASLSRNTQLDGTMLVGPSDPANIVIPVSSIDENEVEIHEVRHGRLSACMHRVGPRVARMRIDAGASKGFRDSRQE